MKSVTTDIDDRSTTDRGIDEQELMNTIGKCKKTRSSSAEQLAVKLAGMSKSQLKRQLLSLKTRFPLDFTEEFLDSLSSDKLRHILLATRLNSR